MPLPQVEWLRCISHHTPTYLPGLNHLSMSGILLGSLRLSSIRLSASPPALSLISIVRHGPVNGPVLCASKPSAHGINQAVSVPAPLPCSSIEGKSTRAASWIDR